jgi:hypothetical protein
MNAHRESLRIDQQKAFATGELLAAVEAALAASLMRPSTFCSPSLRLKRHRPSPLR